LRRLRSFSPRLVDAAARARAAGVSIDNLEALQSQIFAPSGTKHDGAGSAWESLAVGPDGRLYPSPALVGVPDLAADINPDLAGAWRLSPVLDRIRQASAARLILPGGFCWAAATRITAICPAGSLSARPLPAAA
jgi:7,8-dihydro-6-hydroxymethylpterin dimethyltransferase